MATDQRKDRRQKELIELGRQAKNILEERDKLREEAAKWRDIASQQADELQQVNACCEGLRAELLELRKEETVREMHYRETIDNRDARIHKLSSDLQRVTQNLQEAEKKLEAMNGHDIKSLRRRLQQKSEEIKVLKTTIGRLEAKRRASMI